MAAKPDPIDHEATVAATDGPLEASGDDSMAFEYCYDGVWRAYDEHGLVAVAPTWREVWERTGRRWQ